MSKSTAYAVSSSEICWPLPCAIPKMGPLGWQWGDVGGGVFALKEVTVLVRAGSRWNYNPGLGHSQPAVRYFICPAQCFKQFETPASGLDSPSWAPVLLPYKPSSCLAGLNPSLVSPACPHAHGSLPFPEWDIAISTVLWQNDGQRKQKCIGVKRLGEGCQGTCFWQEHRHSKNKICCCSAATLCLFVTPWTAACQASLPSTISWSLLKLKSIESVMLSNHLIFCHPLLLLPSIFPSITVFSNELTLHMRWPKYWSFSISPSNEYSGLISFRIDWFDLLAVQGTLMSLLQHHNSKASILRHSAFFVIQLSHPYMTTRKTITT